MAVVAVSATDIGRSTQHWNIPSEPGLEATPIPRGRRDYGGTVAVPILGAGDETAVSITLTFPTGFVYLPKSLSITFQSDDTTSEFEDLGMLEIQPGLPAGTGANLGTRKDYVLKSEGQAFRAAANSEQIFRPLGTWRQWLPINTAIILRLADMSMDASAAGDVAWTADFWEYDIQQCLQWPVNTPMPQVSY